MSIKMIFLVVALVCFVLGALGVAASINWDQAGKAAVVAALLVW